jgi:electron transfer flavoprotein beta subunit
VQSDIQMLDSMLTALTLQRAIAADGKPDIVFTGRHSIDSEGMQTHYRLAEALGMPVVANVVDLRIADGRALVEREAGGGAREVLRVPMPCVIAATKGLNEPRYPKLPDILKAKKKEIKTLAWGDLGLERSAALTALTGLESVPERGAARMLRGDARQMAEELVRLLREDAKVLE